MAASRARSVGLAQARPEIEQENAVNGESKQSDERPRENRQTDRQGGGRSDSEGRSRSRRSGGGRKGIYRFDDQMEHAICQFVTHRAPQGFPVHNRAELATMPPVEVARTETKILLCDRRHEGPHLWPNGDQVV
jgi:hypothetical protein